MSLSAQSPVILADNANMPSFAYTARDNTGAAVTGTLIADSIAEVTRMLRGDGKYPTSIQPAGQGVSRGVKAQRGIKVSRAQVIQVATQLSIMVDTGVMLSEALNCIALQADTPQLKALLQDLSAQVQAGTDFSSACERHPRSFPRVFVALVKASERTGMMGKLLTRATTYMRDEQETLRRVRGALTYPAIMMLFAVSTTVFLLACVLPKFTRIYAAKGAALPTPTKILMAISQFVIDHSIALPVGLLLLVAGIWMGLKTPRGQAIWHWIELHTPLLGGLFRKVHLSRGLRTIGTVAGSGVGLLDSVQIVQGLTSNLYFRQLWDQVIDQLQAGRQLSEPLFNSNLVPRPIAQMIQSGEKSGKLAPVMEQIATYSEQELKEKIAEMTKYIEPLMIAVMGSIIGSVTIALLLPIFTISKVVAK
jgi:type IV pilus assembly protein PilC